MVRADDFDSALRLRLDAIRETLSSYDVLVQERDSIQALLDLRARSNHSTSSSLGPFSKALAALGGGSGAVSPPLFDDPPAQKRELEPLPVYREDTQTFRLLHHAQKQVLRSPNRELPFLELFESIPSELRGNGRHFREHFRSILQRSGERVDLQYVDAWHVRFVKPNDKDALTPLQVEHVGTMHGSE